MAIFYTIKWFKTDKLLDLIKIAFSIAFAMMTKIDSALIAILIGIVFLVKVIKNRKEIKKYVLYFSIFAIISLPIGLWFPIKNLILYNVPLTYVQSVERNSDASVEKISAMDRFFSVSSKKTFEKINIEMTGKNQDYNLLITTLKTVIVDENIDYGQNKIIDIIIHGLFIFSIIITIIFIINLIYIIKNYKKINNHWILFFLGLLIIESFAYVRFCFEFPFVFTMNFRYIIPTLISFAVFIGIASENNKILLNINKIILILFSIFSIMLFYAMGK